VKESYLINIRNIKGLENLVDEIDREGIGDGMNGPASGILDPLGLQKFFCKNIGT
jgi:hypothetical protein